ncbi:hypothetical protein TNCT_454051 [Trichonephila clavata]|uniref:Uncharacterized protein n=1 Tax=Trichonephila clavata TaxID=2740835 RepID=A0A8X6H154_TRICU|nr:hypothetical protein TNCT_454051 [Trichonephila clavata]
MYFPVCISRWGVSIIRLAAKRVQQPQATFLTASQRDIRIVPFPPANNATRGLPHRRNRSPRGELLSSNRKYQKLKSQILI